MANFLEASRFDRTTSNGRYGLISLRAIDAAFLGLGGGAWSMLAQRLQVEGWLLPDDARQLCRLGAFGDLIANTDMHFGNISAFLGDTRPLRLAPVYDMLPTRYRPLDSGEVVPRDYKPALPNPAQREAWRDAAPLALAFWQQAASDSRVSGAFREIAAANAAQLQKLIARV